MTIWRWKYFTLEMRWNVSRVYGLEGADNSTEIRIECTSRYCDWSNTVCYTLSLCVCVCAWEWSFMCFLQWDHKVEAVSVSRLSKTPRGKGFSAAQLKGGSSTLNHATERHRLKSVSITSHHWVIFFFKFFAPTALVSAKMLDFTNSWLNLSPQC